MIRKAIALLALLTLAACSAPAVTPAHDCPREGGIGGTGDCSNEQKIS
jgi:hypothetical protein